MTPRDKELEEWIEEVGNKLTTPPSDAQQLLLLLDKAENLLSRVEQCPPQSMHDALHSSMKALITRDLLRHSDLDVKVAVASCLSEITRITAPDAPYDDDLMKEIFGLIVGAFKNLDEMSSRSFSKRVSILETVAKVRSCVLMLDLECDDLILDMFHHFLKTIRPKHSDTVFSSMETVMTLVIEESENISTRLLSCLLDHLKIDEKNIMSSAKKLAEKVLASCALKLKPYLAELFKDFCAPLSDYSKIVAAICQENFCISMWNETNNSGETQADDSKLSDNNLCVELPQVSEKQEHKDVIHEKGADADGSSKSVISNGTVQMGNGESMASEKKTENFQSGVQLKDIGGSRLGDSVNLGSDPEKLDDGLNLSSHKGRKRKAMGKLSVDNDRNEIDDGKKPPASTSRRKGRSKEIESAKANDLSYMDVEPVVRRKSGKKNKLVPTPGSDDILTSVSLHTSNDHDEIHSRKSRHPRSKSSRKRNSADKVAFDGSSSSGHKEHLESNQMTCGDLPLGEPSSKKQEAFGESERILLKCSASKSHTFAEDGKTTPTATTRNSETKHQRHRGRSGSQRETMEVDLSGQKQSTGIKQRKGGLHVEEEDKEVKLKELVSSRKSATKESVKKQSHLKDINEAKSGQKRARATKETSGMPKRRKSNEKLVGARIKVWWPDDERFYDGVVDSYDPSTKRHKILYDDGDVEILLLKEETWKFVEAEATEGENNVENITTSKRRDKKTKGRRGHAASDKTETDVPLKSPDSTIKPESNDEPLKRKGRPPAKMHSGDETPKTPKKSSEGRGKSASRQPNEVSIKSDNKNLGQNVKPGTSKSMEKVDNETPKSEDKVGTDTLKIRIKSKGDSSRSSMKSKNGRRSRKKLRESHEFDEIKSNDEGSPAAKSAKGGRKHGGRSSKGSTRKGRGDMTPKININLIENDLDKNDLPKVEEAEGRSTTTTGKKRKRGRLGR